MLLHNDMYVVFQLRFYFWKDPAFHCNRTVKTLLNNSSWLTFINFGRLHDCLQNSPTNEWMYRTIFGPNSNYLVSRPEVEFFRSRPILSRRAHVTFFFICRARSSEGWLLLWREVSCLHLFSNGQSFATPWPRLTKEFFWLAGPEFSPLKSV